VSASFRFHRPRGPLCGRGYCFQCELPTAEGRALACQVSPGAVKPSPRRDPLRPLGAVAERFPPWFYESRMLRPAPLRGISLHVLRYLSAAPPLSAGRSRSATPRPAVTTRAETAREAAARHELPYSEIHVDLAVVGSARCPPGAFLADLAHGSLAAGLYPDRTLGVVNEEGLTAVHFEQIVISTGSYERLPPIAGNDLPGVLGLGALEVYGAAGALRAGTPVAMWVPQDQRVRALACAERYGLSIVWMDERAPETITGRGRVRGVITPAGQVNCELFVTAVRQPAIELALTGGATAELSSDGLPILAVTATPEWMQVVGSAAARTSGVPDVRAADGAFACLCEDVRIGDLKDCVAQGFADPELIKRRTGAMTGPCQGKLCSALVLTVLRELGCGSSPIRARPLARPVSLAELAAGA
jgi:hypothetical protein